MANALQTNGALAAKLLMFVGYAVAFYYAGKFAFDIRIYAIKNYGYVIHEFDPWFNYRATEVRQRASSRAASHGHPAACRPDG